jgi:hypothetical protein
MRFKALIGALIATAAIAVPVSSASAASAAPAAAQAWYWTAQAAADDLVVDGLDDEYDHYDVTYAECEGYGKRYRGGYRHFECYVEAVGYDPFYIAFHVKGKHAGSWDYLGDA